MAIHSIRTATPETSPAVHGWPRTLPTVQTRLDPTPLVPALLEKTLQGKLAWEPTLKGGRYVVSAGGLTFVVGQEDIHDIDKFGNPENVKRPVLVVYDETGKNPWTIRPDDIANTAHGQLRQLVQEVQLVALKLDDRLSRAMARLEEL